MPCAPVQLHVLGQFELIVRGDRVEVPLQAQRVLGYLAVVHPVQSRSVLAERLWVDAPQDRAMATLRNAVWRVRKSGASVIHTSRDNVSVATHVWIDLAHARRCAAAIDLGQPTVTDPQLIKMLDSDVLVGWEDDWLQIERERLRQMRIHALESLAEMLVREGRHAQAIQAALAAVRAEPLRETAQVALINAYLSEGNACEAVRQFESFKRLLGDELGLSPSPRVEGLLCDQIGQRFSSSSVGRPCRPIRT
jgi:DNA-binding SARP family transcriptional activator